MQAGTDGQHLLLISLVFIFYICFTLNGNIQSHIDVLRWHFRK